MKVHCPTCGKLHEYDRSSPFRPFCSERCKLIDLGHWAAGDYVIEGKPGSADPQDPAEEIQHRAQEAARKQEEEKKKRRR